jgi:NitT/TauT family transport system ATP-binding protein
VFLADRVLVMTRRPGTIVEDLRIPFTRPRDFAIGETAEFNEICAHLRSLFVAAGNRAESAPERRA